MIFLVTMGIKHLKTLLKQICSENQENQLFPSDYDIKTFRSVQGFVDSEKKRMYNEYIASNGITNPIKKRQLKSIFNNKPYFVGIDAYLYASKYKRVFERIEFGFFRQILLSLSSHMIPIYVFDGVAPEQKKSTIKQRRNKKRKIYKKLEELLVMQNTTINSAEKILEEIQNKMNGSSLLPDEFETDDNFLTKCSDSAANKEVARLTKKSTTINYTDIKALKQFLDFLKIPYITASGEADDMLAMLYKKKIINACQSDDMDMLPKGCGNVIQINSGTGVPKNLRFSEAPLAPQGGTCENVSPGDTLSRRLLRSGTSSCNDEVPRGILRGASVTQYLLNNILQSIKLNYHQFVDLCILLGSDYYKVYLPKMNSLDLFNLFIKYPSIEQFVAEYAKTDDKIIHHLSAYQKTRSSFIDTIENFDLVQINIEIKPINFELTKIYFEQLGITFGESTNNKFKSLANNVNNFILMVNIYTH